MMVSPRIILLLPALFGALAAVSLAAERPYVNDLKAPSERKHLELLQRMLSEALPKARAATVCIEIGEGSGTGVIVSEDGLVLTAAHVSSGVGKKVTVKTEDGTEHEAITLGLVADSDAAMVKIKSGGPFPFVEIDRNAGTRLGDWVIAIGHSGGFDKDRGSVVRLGRLVRVADSTVQSDCTLIGGDSGGPLFDLNGQLIGIHSRVGKVLQENMHVPMHVFLEHWDAMLASEFIGEGPFAKLPVKGNGFLGFASEGGEGGLRVTRVGGETPAEKAGLKTGDVILEMNGKAVATRDDLKKQLAEMSAGDEVTLKITRGGKEETIKFELGER